MRSGHTFHWSSIPAIFSEICSNYCLWGTPALPGCCRMIFHLELLFLPAVHLPVCISILILKYVLLTREGIQLLLAYLLMCVFSFPSDSPPSLSVEGDFLTGHFLICPSSELFSLSLSSKSNPFIVLINKIPKSFLQGF